MGDFTGLFWLLFFMVAMFWPMMSQHRLTQQRYAALHALERKRATRVITLIHRQESLSVLGIPLARYISIEDSEQVLRAIRFTPDNMPIDLILHTPGGLVLAAEQIARALQKHPGKVTAFIPHYAMSGGTLLALAADEIVMDENAVLGPVDPQIGSYPAASILAVVREKGPEKVEDQTLILADMAGKARRQVEDAVYRVVAEKMPADQARQVATLLTEGRWTHDYPVTVEILQQLGLPVRVGLPREVYEVMELYPQPPQRRPSVGYIPVPYRRPDYRRLPSGRSEWETKR
ncbi:MAG: hypothetical protein IMW99_04710 [Firmicutes bacterium]|nr:hypothetical protein [Bacillota bacterium]